MSKRSRQKETVDLTGDEEEGTATRPLTIAQLIAGVRGPVIQLETGGAVRPPKKAPEPPKSPRPTKPEVLAHPDYATFVEKLKALAGPPVTLRNEVDDTPSPPIAFEFVNQLRLGKDVPGYSTEFVFGCSCPEGGCKRADDCECLEDMDEEDRMFAYDKHGRVRVSNRLAIYECNQRCSCGPECGNRVVQNGRKVELEIFKTEKKGWGKYSLIVAVCCESIAGEVEKEVTAARVRQLATRLVTRILVKNTQTSRVTVEIFVSGVLLPDSPFLRSSYLVPFPNNNFRFKKR